MHIRLAQIEDAPQLLDLMYQRGYPQSLESMTSRLEHYIASPNYGIWIAQDAGIYTGLIAIALYELFTQASKRCRLESLIVQTVENTPCWTTAETLLTVARKYAYHNGCSIFDLTSSINREEAGWHAFYKAQGFHNSGSSQRIYLRLELQPSIFQNHICMP